jgi:hypothetical protein
VCSLATKDGLRAVINKLLVNLKRYPQDRRSILHTFKGRIQLKCFYSTTQCLKMLLNDLWFSRLTFNEKRKTIKTLVAIVPIPM